MFFFEGGTHGDVSGVVSQMAAAHVFGCVRAAVGDHGAAQRAAHRAAGARLSVYRLARDGQDLLRQNSRQGGQLSRSARRRPLLRMRHLPRDRRRLDPRRGRDRCGVQQRCGQHSRLAGGGGLHAGFRQISRLYHRRGAHAVRRGVQRTAQDAGGAAGARDLYPGDDRGAQAARDHSLPLSALRFRAHSRRRHRGAAAIRRRTGAVYHHRRRGAAACAAGGRRAARRTLAARPVPVTLVRGHGRGRDRDGGARVAGLSL